ncbi:MAG: hypothetical protein DLM52_11230 [Chthoniobacterales bacterium]|nr:MAG: hypothetical protein DLM52_11230 [Chthoniobacterales bacterium]
MVNFWIRNFPAEQQEAIRDAITSARLGKVRRALQLVGNLPPQLRGPGFNIELLSTYNLEPILSTLKLALRCLPSSARLELAPLNDIESYIASSSFLSSAEGANARVILWRIEELMPEILYPLSNGFPEQLARRVDEVLTRLEGVVSLHQRHSTGAPLFLSTLASPLNYRLLGSQHSAGAYASVARFNQRVYDLAATRHGVYALDFAAWAATEGNVYADPLLDFMARQPLAARSQVSFAFFLAKSLRPLLSPAHKVLAIDLDNTLWGGVIGEDGVNGLKLGQEFPGNVHLRIQRELLELRNRGILLVLLSKNNEADARLGFDTLPEMLLKWDDFAVRKVNWKDKHENLRAASQELGLGLDSFTFIDDSDYERELMRQLLPEVRILNNNGDPLQILRSLWDTDAFDSLTLTAEDRARHGDYAVRSARTVQGHEDNVEAFLQSLEMEATIEEIGPANIDRVVNMLGKTNQFNLTTRRHSHPEVEVMLRKEGTIALALRLRDKFGEQGIIAVLLALRGRDGTVFTVDSFLVSCRALGRGVEDALWAAFLQRASGVGARKLEAAYIPTPKNGIASALYDRLGLERVGNSAESSRYQLDPLKPAVWPRWIADRTAKV